MIRRLLASTALVLALGLPGHAQSLAPEPAPAGTAEGAAALRKSFAAYLTEIPFEQGLLRIEPDPAGQRITLSPQSFLSGIAGFPVQFAPLAIVVSERPDGNWNVFSRDPIKISTTGEIEGAITHFQYDQATQLTKGVYSPALAAFTQAEGTAERITNVQEDATTRSKAEIGKATVEMTGRPGATGGVDIDIRQTYDDWRQTSAFTPPRPDEETEGTEGTGSDPGTVPESAPEPIEIAMTARTIEASAALRDGRTVAIRDLYALAVQHTGELATDPKAALAGPLGAQLKDAIGKVLPLWASLSGEATARDVTLSSLYGEFGFAEGRHAMRFTGIEDNAGFDMDVSVKGMRATSPLMPAWAASLLPQDMDLGFAMSGADLKTPAAIALAEVDFTADPPLSPEAQAQVQAAFDPTRIVLQLKPSRLRSADLDVTASGDFAFREGAPSANVTLEAAGLDKVIGKLQSAAQSEPDLHQTVGMLQFAKGFGRAKGEDRMEWIVAAAADGSVTVNGTMVKGPDPVAEPGDDEDVTPGDELENGDIPGGETQDGDTQDGDTGASQSDL
ncbi:hypothetical protein ACP4J4_20005 (plasmid) [Aureimonas ureilytica]|uniref:hypothetical protein n=1 Tax=Aureimonas ureilytica TaxID=401562 RepID=UPI003CFB830F